VVNNSLLILHFKEKKEQHYFKRSSCCVLALASQLYKQMHLTTHSYTLIATSKKIKSNLSTDAVMSLKKSYFIVFMLFNPVRPYTAVPYLMKCSCW